LPTFHPELIREIWKKNSRNTEKLPRSRSEKDVIVTILLLSNTKTEKTQNMLFQKCKVKSSLAKRSESNSLMVVKKEKIVVIVETEIAAVIVEIETVMIEIVVIVPRRKPLNVLFVRKLVIGPMNAPTVLAKVSRKEHALFAEVLNIR